MGMDVRFQRLLKYLGNLIQIRCRVKAESGCEEMM